MRLRNAVLGCRVARWPLDRSDGSLAGNSAPQLVLHFLSAAFLHRVGATSYDQRARAQDRQGLHLLILGKERSNAIAENVTGLTGFFDLFLRIPLIL